MDDTLFLLLSTVFVILLACSSSYPCHEYDDTLPVPLMYHQMVYFEHLNTIYIFGGMNITDGTRIYMQSIYKWNIWNKSSWFELINSTTPTTKFSSFGNNVVVINEKAYFIGIYDGSFTSGSIYIFDPSTDSFIPHNTSSPPNVTSQGCLTTNNSHILMSGGRNDVLEFSDILQIYDINNNVWHSQQRVNISSTNNNGFYAQYCSMINNTLYVFGGSGDLGYYQTYFKYEWNRNNEWSLLGFKSTATRSGATVYFNKSNRIYLIGGYQGHRGVTIIDEFDVNNERIIETYSMNQPLYGSTAMIINETLYIFGGGIQTDTENYAVSLVQICDMNDFKKQTDPSISIEPLIRYILIGLVLIIVIFASVMIWRKLKQNNEERGRLLTNSETRNAE